MYFNALEGQKIPDADNPYLSVESSSLDRAAYNSRQLSVEITSAFYFCSLVIYITCKIHVTNKTFLCFVHFFYFALSLTC